MKIHEFKMDGFDIVVNALDEDCKLKQFFDESEHDIEQIARDIDSGKLVYFCAQVVASKASVELGTAYLGCCLYDNYDQFLNDSYLDQLVDESIKDANINLEKLIERLTA